MRDEDLVPLTAGVHPRVSGVASRSCAKPQDLEIHLLDDSSGSPLVREGHRWRGGIGTDEGATGDRCGCWPPCGLGSAPAGHQPPSPDPLGVPESLADGPRVATHDRCSLGSPDGTLPLVLLHGLAVSHRHMMPLAARLAGHHPVHVVDLPGFGLSSEPGWWTRRRVRPSVRSCGGHATRPGRTRCSCPSWTSSWHSFGNGPGPRQPGRLSRRGGQE